MAADELFIAVAIKEDRDRARFVEELKSACNACVAPTDSHFDGFSLAAFVSLESLADALNAHFDTSADRFAIVASDMLVNQGEFDLRAKELIDPHFLNPLVTLAVTSDGLRVPEIDRVVPRAIDSLVLVETLKLLMGRLRYMAPPVARDYPNLFRVRRIDGEFELSRYYRLRHDVYRVMGYMSEKKERVPTQLEIDGCDANAIHLGAFEECAGYQPLVGTSRVLLAKAGETKWAAWTRSLLRADRSLQVLVRNETLALGLPVFQSQQLNDHLQEAFEKNLLSAELSRVIIAYDYRGAGLGRKLVQASIDEAKGAGVDRLYLECLPLHESFYAKFGFQTIPGASGQVIGVSKSMIAMMIELPVGVTAAR